MSREKNKTTISFHPGYYINEIIEEMEITQEEFALRSGTSAKTISELVNEKIGISKELARKFSDMLDTSPDVWLDLQKRYDVQMIEEKRTEELEAQKGLIHDVDYSYFVKLGLLPSARGACMKVKNLCAFLAVSNLSILTSENYNLSFRKGSGSQTQKNILISNIWVETATKLGRNIETRPYSEKRLKSTAATIADMTTQDMTDVIPTIKSMLAECGVALILLPYLKNSGLHGVVKWLSKDKALVAISDRRKYSDTFWFTLLHEIGHVLQKRIKDISYTWEDQTTDAQERDADGFARDTLIPPSGYECFISTGTINAKAITSFAEQIGRDRGIVVGRLQIDHKIGYDQFNDLRSRIPESCFTVDHR